jgi:tRNA1Val (adenine37-N6)-methyltransferase
MKVTTDACLFGSLLPTSSKGGGVKKVLDIGTGTGLLTLMYAQKNMDAILDAIEIDKEAAEQAEENVKNSPWKERINVIHADVKDYPFSKKYDLIISNPPFYENELKSVKSKKNIAHHNEGILLEELLLIIKKNLNPDGLFCLLLPYKRNEEIKKLFKENEFEIIRMTLVRQSVNHDYFRIMLTGKFKSNEVSETKIEEISICDEKQQYTPEFVELLKEYYLHL